MALTSSRGNDLSLTQASGRLRLVMSDLAASSIHSLPPSFSGLSVLLLHASLRPRPPVEDFDLRSVMLEEYNRLLSE